MPADRFNEYCENLLTQYKRTNTKPVTQRLESVCEFLRQKGNVVQTMFGGSVRKGTYVTGLADVDALLIVNQSSLVNQPPAGRFLVLSPLLATARRPTSELAARRNDFARKFIESGKHLLTPGQPSEQKPCRDGGRGCGNGTESPGTVHH